MRILIQNGRLPSPLLQTGQTTSYGSGDGLDDGAYQKGIKKPTAAYTILTTGQYSGNTNLTINSKTQVKSNNCVIDQNTGLMWSRSASASVGPASDGHLPWTTTGAGETAEGIWPYLAAANAASLAGWNDWRIPNLFELLSIMDYEAPNSNPDSTAFNSDPNGSIWTSTTCPSDTTRAFQVNSWAATTPRTVKTDADAHVRLVRGG